MIPAELDTGPPSKMRRPSWKPGRREVSIERATTGTYPATARMSSPLVRLACAALSAEELEEWICRHLSPGEGEPCP